MIAQRTTWAAVPRWPSVILADGQRVGRAAPRLEALFAICTAGCPFPTPKFVFSSRTSRHKCYRGQLTAANFHLFLVSCGLLAKRQNVLGDLKELFDQCAK